MGFSRQAAQQVVDRLVEQGMLRVEGLRENKRDKIVVITDKGHRWRSIAAAQIKAIEAHCEQAIGVRSTEELRQHLIALLDLLTKRNCD